MTTIVCFTVDVESDCPPYLTGYRGIQHGLPALLDLLDRTAVPATCFVTGDVARRFPGAVSGLVARGHELGSHGMTHRRFSAMTEREARDEIEGAAEELRAHAPVTSFRAPNLDFPASFLPLLRDAGFRLDSSGARYKWNRRGGGSIGGIARVPASVTSSVLRLPRILRDRWLRGLSTPVVLFVHPWEFVDLTRERLRYDCRFRTGRPALESVREVLEGFRERGAHFVRMGELAEGAGTAGSLVPPPVPAG